MPRPLLTVPDDRRDVLIIDSRDRAQRPRSTSVASTCTIGREDPDLQELFVDEVIDLTVDETVGVGQGLLRQGELALSQTRVSGTLIRTGDFIETDTHLGNYEVDFVRIKIIAQHGQTGRVTLRGIPFSRTRKLKGQVPKKLNEVCMILHFRRNDGAGVGPRHQRSNKEEEPILVDVLPEFVVRKRELIITNAIYPENRVDRSRYRHISDDDARMRAVERSAPLVCRWQLKVYFTIQGQRTRPEEEAVIRIHATEVEDAQYRVSEDALCYRWRGGRVNGGSWSAVTNLSSAIDLEEDGDPRPLSRGLDQKYTVFDSFCGAGGVSRGAQSAGFKIEFAVDNSPNVWETYATNFPDATLYEMSVDEFIRKSKRQRIRVDILHLSPPCQFFSPAHTHQAAHDDDNIFALFGCNELINKTRPRLVTLEQTFGLTHDRHLVYFRALVGDFTQLGYSIRWKVVHLCTWGSAQDRKRLILIAAGPGERLPPFPKATHSADGRAKPFATIRQALESVRRGDNMHDLDRAKRYRPPRAPYNPDCLAGTITTGGSESHYPDGTRDFTLREYASLQGFPRYHRFQGNKTSVKRQIRNAFPPNTVRVLYSHLEAWLLKEDDMARQEPHLEDIIMVDDDSDSSVVGYTGTSEHEESPEMEDDVMEVDSNPLVRQGAAVGQDRKEVIDLT